MRVDEDPGRAAAVDIESVDASPTDFSDRLIRWGRLHFQTYPWRAQVPEWQALVAEVLLLRTRASQVVPVFERFREKYRSPEDLVASTLADVETLIGSLGLRWRAPLLHTLFHEIGRRQGHPPNTERELRQLPGVGSYAAAAMLSLHGGVRAVIVDANVVRVLCRLTGRAYDGETRRKRWLLELAERLTPADAFRDYNYALLDLAMTTCLRTSPLCHDCPVSVWCKDARSRLP